MDAEAAGAVCLEAGAQTLRDVAGDGVVSGGEASGGNGGDFFDA